MNEPKCPKCLKGLGNQIAFHFSTPNLCHQGGSVIKISNTCVIYEDGSCICLRCLKIFKEEVEWFYHRKKISTVCTGYKSQAAAKKDSLVQQQKTSAHQQISYSESIEPSHSKSDFKSARLYSQQNNSATLISNTSFFSNVESKQKIPIVKQITQQQETALILLDLFLAKCKLKLIQWVNVNFRIKRVFLQKIFQRYTDKFISQLYQEIKSPSFEMLSKNLKINWKNIISDPADIFDQQQIKKRVENMAPSMKGKVFRCLNSIYHSNYNDIFPKFTIDYEPLKKRLFLPLRTIDFFEILQSLFQTKQKCFVHIAIDFYLIFQSGQRSKSDKTNIQQGVANLLRERKNQKNLSQITIKINKTNRIGNFILSQQLCQLLQQFKWTHFFKDGSLYERMFKIFGFPAYSIKKCLFSEFKMQQYHFSKVQLTKLALHSSQSTAMIYAKAGEQSKIKLIKDKLKVPNLIFQTISKDQLLKNLANFPEFKSFAKINQNWMLNLRKKITIEDKSFVDFCLPPVINPNSDKQTQQIKQDIINDKIDKDAVVSKTISASNKDQKLISEQVEILEQTYIIENAKFNLQDLFIQGQIQYCLICNSFNRQKSKRKQAIDGKACKFCTANYHIQCLPKFCSCLSIPINVCDSLKYSSASVLDESSLKLNMPAQYFGTEWVGLDQIMFLLAARRLYYTTTSLILQSSIISPALTTIQSFKLSKLLLPKFQEYVNGNYFPPIQIKQSGFKNVSGTGFGIFATADIEPNSFIGQYAADILTERYSLQVKRPDSIITLVNGDRPDEKVIIGPVKRCGYVCLINGSKPKEANCLVKTVQLEGYIRIILFTHKKIKNGVQLLYNYDRNSEFKAQSLKVWKKSVIERINQPQNTNSKGRNRCGLQNLGNTCYINSVIQFLKITLNDYFQPNSSTSNQLTKILSQLFRKMNCFSKIAPKQQIEQFIKLSKGLFELGKQQDAHQFLHFLLSNLDEIDQVKQLVTGFSKIETTCSACSKSFINYDKFISYMVDCKENSLNEHLKVKRQLVSDYFCNFCHIKGTAIRIQKIDKYPSILIILVKRYTNDLQKSSTLYKHLTFQKQQYRLSSIIEHEGGNTKAGHYKTIEIVGKQQMIIFNDAKISGIQLFQSDQPNILGYVKKQ